MKQQMHKKSAGFTLIELLVVISIIATLASVIMVTVDRARSFARDAQRKAALQQIQVALELYRNDFGTYQVLGGASMGSGQGWFALENGASYAVATSRVLYNLGYLSVPILEDPTTRPGYMMYVCDGGQTYAVTATLENPTADDIAKTAVSCGNSATATLYGKNYVRTNSYTTHPF